LRELQWQLRYTRRSDISEFIRNHIIDYDLLNTPRKGNKLQVFCYYLRATANISSAELESIKAEGEEIISAFKKPKIIREEFRAAILSCEKILKEVPASEDIEPIILNQIPEHKSILKKTKNTAPIFGKKISFGLFPTIKWVCREGKGALVNPHTIFPRFISMIEALGHHHGTKASSLLFLDLCVDFFNESTAIPNIHSIDENELFAIVNEFNLAATQCKILADEECPALFVATVTRVLIAFKPLLKKEDHEDMICKLFQYLSSSVQSSNELDGENDNILDLMYKVINGDVDYEKEVTQSPVYF
jgi:hypothetical protein